MAPPAKHGAPPPSLPPTDIGLVALTGTLASFRAARSWDAHCTPRNLVLAMVAEVGELAECFQWKADAGAGPGLPGWSEAERTHLGEEVSDVLMYLLQLADKCGVDLVQAVPRKIAMNGRKYPPGKPAPEADDACANK